MSNLRYTIVIVFKINWTNNIVSYTELYTPDLTESFETFKLAEDVLLSLIDKTVKSANIIDNVNKDIYTIILKNY